MKKKIFLFMSLAFLFLFNPYIVKGEKIQDPSNPLVYYDELFFIDIDAGNNHSVALTDEGRIFTFGDNGYGQLGNGVTIDESSPIDVTSSFVLGSEENIVDVDAGGYHTGALTSDNQLFLWGYNFYGQLGDSTNTDKLLPLNVTSYFSLGVDEVIVSFALGTYNTIVLSNQGRVFTFGSNFSYQIGDQTTVNKNYPVDITSFFDLEPTEVVIKVEFDYEYAAAITNLGKIFLWGRNSDGQLGINTLTSPLVPTNATSFFNLNPDEKIIDVELGYDHTFVLTDQNRTFGFGENMYRQVGDDTSVDKKTPVYINNNLFSAALNKQYISFAAGYKDSMIITTAGDVLTFGYGDYGQRGNGTNVTSIYKSNITINLNLQEGELAIQGEMGYHHSLILTSLGRILSFGRNHQGQLGIGTVTAYNAWPSVVNPKANQVTINESYLPIGENIVDVATGYLSSVLVTETGKVFTWGYNDFGSLGNDNLVTTHANPMEITANFILAANDKIIKVFAGTNSSSFAAISELGKVFVWGFNSFGNLGDFTTDQINKPKDITSNFSVPSGDYITQIALGPTHSLALSNNGVVWSFGTNDAGQLGNTSTTSYYYPQNILSRFSLNPGEYIIKVDAGFRYSAALTNYGRLFMWGSRSEAQLGDEASSTLVITPSDRTSLLGLVASEYIVDFDLGYTHTIVVTSFNRAIGFGSNNYGQIGNLTTSSTSLPYDLTANLNLSTDLIVSLDVGNGSTVVITDTDRIIAFGNSNSNLTIDSTVNPTDITSAFNLGEFETISKYALSTLNSFLLTSDNRLLGNGRNDYYSIGNGLNTPFDNYIPIQINQMISDVGNILLVESPEILYDNLVNVPIVIYPEFNIGDSLVSITINGTVYNDFEVVDGRIFIEVTHSQSYDTTLLVSIESFEFLNGTTTTSGNTTASTQFIIDVIPPTFDFIPDQTIEAGTEDIDWATYIINEEDNAGGALIKFELFDSVDYYFTGIYSVTVLLADEAFNETTQTFNVEVIDTTAPTFDLIPNQTIEAGTEDIDWTDYIINPIDNSFASLMKIETNDEVDYNTVGLYTVTVKLVDDSLNETSQTFEVMVIDTTAPSFNFIEDQIVELGTPDIDWTTYITNEMDNSDLPLTKIEFEDNIDYNSLGTYTVTVKLVDDSLNETSQTFNVTLEDTTAPTFALIEDQTIEVDINYVPNWTALITDEMDNSVAPLPRTVEEDNVIYSQVGIYTVTVKLTDQSGNATSQTFTVNVVDTIAPTFDFIEDQTLELGVSYDNDFWRSVVHNLFDNSSEEVTVSIEDSAVDYTQIGVYPLVVIVTDNYSNQVIQGILVEIVDTTSPEFDYILAQVIEAGVLTDVDWSSYINNPTDNSNTTLTKVEVLDNVIYNKVGDYEVTVKLVDESGNETTQTFTVTVTDTISPNFSFIEDQVIEVGEFTDIDWTYLVENLEDNGFDELNIQEYDRINYGVVGSYVVTMVVSDISGNQLSRDFTVEVIDTTAPSCDPIEEQILQAGDFIPWEDLVVNLNDNSNQYVDIYILSDMVDYYTPGNYQVTLRLMDLYDNFTLVYIDVVVIDTLAPFISYIEDQIFEAGEFFEFDWTTLMTGVYDNTLKEMDKYWISSTVDFRQAGQYQVVLGARDSSMNETTITVNVIITDTVAPEVYLMHSVDTVFIGDDYIDEGVLTVDATYIDVLVEGFVNTSIQGTYMLTYTVTDTGGNTGTAKRIVTVIAKEEKIDFVLNAGLTTIKKGDEYTDSGCMVYLNGALYNEATIIETDLDLNQAGIYYILYGYTYQDKEYTYKRIVFVVDELVNEPLVLVMWKEDEE